MLNERLRERRKNKGLTQKQLGDLVGASEFTISKYERGINEPDADTLRKICVAIDCTADYLIGKTDNPDSNVYTHNDVLIELSKEYPYELTPDEVNKLVKLLKEYKFDIESLIDDVKKGIVK